MNPSVQAVVKTLASHVQYLFPVANDATQIQFFLFPFIKPEGFLSDKKIVITFKFDLKECESFQVTLNQPPFILKQALGWPTFAVT